MNVDRAFVHADLGDVVVQIQDRERRVSAQADGSRSEAHFNQGILIGPEFVADSDRPVDFCGGPIIGAGWLK